MNQTDLISHVPDVLIIGASARAAAMSAARAGWRVWAVDFFGDEDLKQTACQHRRIEAYRELPAVIADWPKMPWLATGALENHPKLIERLSRERPHWGNPSEVMRPVRDPRRLAQVLEDAGLLSLAIWPGTTPPPPDGRWMLKPRRSAGGQGIFIWDEEAAPSPEALTILGKPHLFQQRAEDEAASALFLSERDRVVLVGVSRLLRANAPAPRFGYGGAIGPVVFPQEVETQILQAGQAIGQRFGLRGLWGMDFLHDGSRVWITEVNPRYTATVELYEHAYGTELLPAHRRACERWQWLPEGTLHRGIVGWNETPPRPICIGKVVLYADRDLPIPPWGNWITARDALLPELPILADRPRAGSLIERGLPICSLFASGSTEGECQTALNHRVQELQTHFQ